MGNPQEAADAAKENAKPESSPTSLEGAGSLPEVLNYPDAEGTHPTAAPYGTPSSTIQVYVQLPKRNLCDSYILWLPPFGLLGAHHHFLRRHCFGILYMFTFGLLGVGWIVDGFRMAWLVKKCNEAAENPSKEKNRKNISDAYLLWFPLGLIGAHNYYLRRWPWAVAYTFTFGFVGLGWLVDGIRMHWLVKQANKNIEDEEEAGNPEKSLCLAYVFGMTPLGILGFHHYYLGRPLYGLAYTFTLGLVGVGWIVDWFRMPILVKRANRKITDGDDGMKYLDDAYVLLFPLGFLGLHHFYLRRYGWGVLYFFSLGCFGLGWLSDFCRLPCLVKQANRVIMEQQRLVEHVRDTMGPDTSVIITPHAGVTGYAGGANSVYPTLPGYGATNAEQGTYPGQQILQPPPYNAGWGVQSEIPVVPPAPGVADPSTPGIPPPAYDNGHANSGFQYPDEGVTTSKS